MEDGKKVDIPLTSPIDVRSSDMLVNVNNPEFEHNRQKYQGHMLQSSLRFEKDGWAASDDVYNFNADEGVIPVTGTEWTARKFKLNNNAAYLIEIYDENNKLIGNVCINASNKIIDTYNIDTPDVTDGENSVIISGTFNGHDFQLIHNYTLVEEDDKYVPHIELVNADEALSVKAYIDSDGVWSNDDQAFTYQKAYDYNTSGNGAALIRLFDNETAEEISIAVRLPANVVNRSLIDEVGYEMGVFATAENVNGAMLYTFNMGVVYITYNGTDIGISGIDNIVAGSIDIDDTTTANNIRFTFRQIVRPDVTLGFDMGDKTFFGLKDFVESARQASLIEGAPASDIFVDNDISISSADIMTDVHGLDVRGSFPIWSSLDIKLPDSPFTVTGTNSKVLGAYIQASQPNSPVPEQRTTQTLSMLKIYSNNNYIPDPVYSYGTIFTPRYHQGIFTNVTSDSVVDPGKANSVWLPWSASDSGRADTMIKAYGYYDSGIQFDASFFKYNFDVYLCDIDPVAWSKLPSENIPDKNNMYYLALKTTLAVDSAHTVELKQNMPNNVSGFMTTLTDTIRVDGTDSAKQDNGIIYEGSSQTFNGPVYALDMQLNKLQQRYIADYHLDAKDTSSYLYTTLGLSAKDAPAFAIYARSGTPDTDFTVDKDSILQTTVTRESNEIKLHVETYDFYKHDTVATYGTDATKDPATDPDATITTRETNETYNITCKRNYAYGYTEYQDWVEPVPATSGSSGTPGHYETRRINQTFGPELILSVNTIPAYITNKGTSTDPIIEILEDYNPDMPYFIHGPTLLRVPLNKTVLKALSSTLEKLWVYYTNYAIKIAPQNGVNDAWNITNISVDDFNMDNNFAKFVNEHLVFCINDISVNGQYIKDAQLTALPVDTRKFVKLPHVDMSGSNYWIRLDDREYFKTENTYLPTDASPSNEKAYNFFMAPCIHTLGKTLTFNVQHSGTSTTTWRIPETDCVLPDGSLATHRAMLAYDTNYPKFPSLLNTFIRYDNTQQVAYSGEYGPDATKTALDNMLPFYTRLEDGTLYDNFTGFYGPYSKDTAPVVIPMWQAFMHTPMFSSNGYDINLKEDMSSIQQGYGLLMPYLAQLEDGAIEVIYNGSTNKVWSADTNGPAVILWAKKISDKEYKFFMFQRCMVGTTFKLANSTYKDFSAMSFVATDFDDYPAYTDTNTYMKQATRTIDFSYAGNVATVGIRVRDAANIFASHTGPAYVGYSGDAYPVFIYDIHNTSNTDNEFSATIFIKSNGQVQNMTIRWPKPTDTVNNTIDINKMFLSSVEDNELFQQKLYEDYQQNVADAKYTATLGILAQYIMYKALMNNMTKSITIDNDLDIHDYYRYLFKDFQSSESGEVIVTAAVNTISEDPATIGNLTDPYQYVTCSFNNCDAVIFLRFNRMPVELNTDNYTGKYMTLEFITDPDVLADLASETEVDPVTGETTYVINGKTVRTIEESDVITKYVITHDFNHDPENKTRYEILPVWADTNSPIYYVAYNEAATPYNMPKTIVFTSEIEYDCTAKILQLIADGTQLTFNCDTNGNITNVEGYGTDMTINTNTMLMQYKDEVYYVPDANKDRTNNSFEIEFTYRVWCSIVAVLRGVYKYSNAFDGGDD